MFHDRLTFKSRQGHVLPPKDLADNAGIESKQDAMFRVTFDTRRKLVRAVMAGLLTVDDVERFSIDEQDAVRAMGVGSGDFLLLIEARGNVVQSQKVVDAFQKLMLNSPLKARRIATVRTGALPTLQTRRIATVRDSARVFETVEDAESWLFG